MLKDYIALTKWILQQNIVFETDVLTLVILPKKNTKKLSISWVKKGLKLNLQVKQLLCSDRT